MSWGILRLLLQAREGIWPPADTIASLYEELSLSAPSRAGLPLGPHAVTGGSFAVALLNASRGGQPMMLPGGGRLRLVDADISLKSHRADLGKCRIDLLGMLEDQSLAVLSLQSNNATEPLIAAFIEMLVGVAVLNANIAAVANQAGAVLRCRVEREAPRGVLVADAAGWEEVLQRGDLERLLPLRDAVAAACGLDLRLLRLDDAQRALGPDGVTPIANGHLLLRDYPAGDRAGRPALRWPTMIPSDPAGFIVEQIQSSWRRGVDDVDERVEMDPPPPPAPAPTPVANDNDRRRRPRTPRARRARNGLSSTQALAQSVFAGLEEAGRLAALDGLLAEDGFPAFPPIDAATTLAMRQLVLMPGETTPSEVDLVLSGSATVFVEVKLAEARFAICGNPGLTPSHPSFASDLCTGAYRVQNHRHTRCTLSEQGMRLWELIPELFDVDGARDHDPCPLFANYALVRRVLAVCTNAHGVLATTRRHVLVVYDDRNPAFWPGGEADEQWHETVRLLRLPRLLRRVSWQKLIGHLAAEPAIAELVNAVSEKYDFPVEAAV